MNLAPSFPTTVDERAARLVATGVVLLTGLALLQPLLAVLLALGFALRVGWGPRLSPLARFATRTLVPRLSGPPRLVPGPPKRFAQTLGLVVSGTAAFAALAGHSAAARTLLAALMLAAGLEAGLGWCLGCALFARLHALGVLPAELCERCADLTHRTSP